MMTYQSIQILLKIKIQFKNNKKILNKNKKTLIKAKTKIKIYILAKIYYRLAKFTNHNISNNQ